MRTMRPTTRNSSSTLWTPTSGRGKWPQLKRRRNVGCHAHSCAKAWHPTRSWNHLNNVLVAFRRQGVVGREGFLTGDNELAGTVQRLSVHRVCYVGCSSELPTSYDDECN